FSQPDFRKPRQRQRRRTTPLTERSKRKHQDGRAPSVGKSRDGEPAGSMVAVSIIIPVLNRADHIGRAIASVTDQGVEDLEIIVVDGGSTDGTQAAAASLRHVVLIDAPNSSMYEALNIGIKRAGGPLISHLNSDDRLLPGSLHAMLEAAMFNP